MESRDKLVWVRWDVEEKFYGSNGDFMEKC